MTWTIERTNTFLDALKQHKKNTALLDALDKKMQRLAEDPTSIGGKLSGSLHGWQATRLIRKFRLLFMINQETKTVYLGAIDHRDEAY